MRRRLAVWTALACTLPVTGRAAPPSSAPEAGPATDWSAEDFAGAGSAALRASAPLVFGEKVIAAHRRGDGGVLIGKKALYRVDGAGAWTTTAWAEGFEPGVSFELGADLWVTGTPGGLWRIAPEGVEALELSGLRRATLELPWRAAWPDATSAEVWVLADYQRLLRISIDDAQVRSYRVPAAAQGQRGAGPIRMEGRRLEGETQLLLSIGPRVFVWREGELRELESLPANPERLELGPGPDEGRARVGETAVPLSLGPREEGPELSEIDEGPLGFQARVKTRRPADSPFWFPTLRVSPAVELRFASPVPAFGLELGVGTLLAPPSGRGPERRHATKTVEAWFWPELGYSWSSDARSLGHAAFAGVGFGVGNDFVAGYYKPRVLVGAFDRGVDPGLRHGVSAQAFWGALGLELSHGMAFAEAGVGHDLRVSLDLNLLAIGFALILATR